ncbi:MAG: late competence development ComFB family protein [Gomphosphaeria aponina SAG 52.96 = DSM 107014]|uniref:Late competence development ComFB family protein n=1 Tax=Gomphosphaeria aponina SAG 52.96 = DSM 107014 TaxID=1521640 RepID=A0A941GWN9_9CHRO|nr:late competence development ComFB family protein [Gomphosphaeria aponina SAG 52.96 = DSM 107014]
MNNNNITQTNQNAMELLVGEEIEKQMQLLPAKVAEFINQVEVATFALNRLPPLYASSKEGLQRQKNRGKKELKKQIELAVQQGLAAVQRDPLRMSTPLVSEEDRDLLEANAHLQKLLDLVPDQDISWLVDFVQELLTKIENQEMTEEYINQLYYKLYGKWNDETYYYK